MAGATGRGRAVALAFIGAEADHVHEARALACRAPHDPGSVRRAARCFPPTVGSRVNEHEAPSPLLMAAIARATRGKHGPWISFTAAAVGGRPWPIFVTCFAERGAQPVEEKK